MTRRVYWERVYCIIYSVTSIMQGIRAKNGVDIGRLILIAHSQLFAFRCVFECVCVCVHLCCTWLAFRTLSGTHHNAYIPYTLVKLNCRRWLLVVVVVVIAVIGEVFGAATTEKGHSTATWSRHRLCTHKNARADSDTDTKNTYTHKRSDGKFARLCRGLAMRRQWRRQLRLRRHLYNLKTHAIV